MRLVRSRRESIQSVFRWIAAVVFCGGMSGCESGTGNTETDAKTRLTKLLRLYQFFGAKNNSKGPANEQQLREFAAKLTPQELDEQMIGNELDTLFVSSRDMQPFVIKYGLVLRAGGETRAVAWEATGEHGKRYVALSMGYVEEYDEEAFKEYNK